MKREIYKKAVSQAQELLEKIAFSETLIDTDKVIEQVQTETGYLIKVYKTDFSRYKVPDMAKCGGLMSVEKKKTDSAQGEVSIFLNNKYSPQMMRFSAMHEIGHLVTMNLDNLVAGRVYASAHINADISYISEKDVEGSTYLETEQAANIFALSILMPKDKFKSISRQYSIETTAVLFGVTPDAVMSRYKMLMAD